MRFARFLFFAVFRAAFDVILSAYLKNLNGGLLATGAVAVLAGAIVAVVGALPIHADLTAGPGAVMITRRVTF